MTLTDARCSPSIPPLPPQESWPPGCWDMRSHGTGMMMTTIITTAAAITARGTAVTGTINIPNEKTGGFPLPVFLMSGVEWGSHFAGSRNFAIVSRACFKFAAASCFSAFSSSPAYSKWAA